MTENIHILKAQKELFIETLARTGNLTSSAQACGWKYPAVAEFYKEKDPDFSLAWDDAHNRSIDALEAEARRRAVEGTVEDVYYMGHVVGSTRKYSDKLLETLLKAERPERFGNQQMQSGGSTPGVLVIHRSDPNTLDIEDWETNARNQQQALLKRSE